MTKTRKILQTLALLTTALATISMFAAPAMAETLPTAEVTQSSDNGIVWFEANVAEAEGSQVVTKIFAPNAKGSKQSLWQRCNFSFSGAGTYRCGIDMSAGSLASERNGVWTVRVISAETVLTQSNFRL